MINIEKLSKDGFNVERFKRGQIIIAEGESNSEKMYILLEGSADVYKNYQKLGEIMIATLHSGDFFGEMSLFLNKVRTATVVAREDVTALAIDNTNAYELFEKQPEATYSLIQTLCSRLENTNANIADNHVKYEKDIITLNNEKTKLEKVANLDGLTGIYNRRYFMYTASMLVKSTLKKGEGAYIVIFDLDFFKKVNDTYGHTAGDVVLKSVAKMVSNSIRPSDLLARYGGEEFVLLITNMDKMKVIEFTDNIRLNIRKETIIFEDMSISVTASFGIAEITKENDVDAALSLADIALYRAKKEGRDRVLYYN